MDHDIELTPLWNGLKTNHWDLLHAVVLTCMLDQGVGHPHKVCRWKKLLSYSNKSACCYFPPLLIGVKLSLLQPQQCHCTCKLTTEHCEYIIEDYSGTIIGFPLSFVY